MIGRTAVVVAALMTILVTLGCERSPSPPAQPPPSVEPAPQRAPESPAPVQSSAVPPAYAGELPPIPAGPFPMARPVEIVRAVYTFAARHPEVLSRVPCFCGCEQRGHGNNDDCFISSRDAEGRPVWDPHGMG